MSRRPPVSGPLRLLFILFLAFPLSAVNGAPPPDSSAKESKKEDEKNSSRVRLVWENRPSLRFGDVLRMDLRVKMQGDFRGFSPDLPTEEGLFDLRRARLAVEGRFLKRFDFEVERELSHTTYPWRDVWVNFRYLRSSELRAGKYKIPFGMEQLTRVTNLDYVFRSRINDYLAPAREVGIEAHGHLFEGGLSYQAGLFRQDDENARTAQRTFAGRVSGTPLRLLPAPAVLKHAEFGAAFTSSTVPEGLKGLRGRTLSKDTFFPRLHVHGQAAAGSGDELESRPILPQGGVHACPGRTPRPGAPQREPADLISRGWYLGGAWVVTGEKKAGGIEPRKDFLSGHGIGAVELAARHEQLRFGSSEHPGRPPAARRPPTSWATATAPGLLASTGI